jgi:hypothetical protein
MNAAVSHATASASDSTIEQIARSTGKSVSVVEEIYHRTLDSVTSDARIAQFVQVIAIRRTMIELKSR